MKNRLYIPNIILLSALLIGCSNNVKIENPIRFGEKAENLAIHTDFQEAFLVAESNYDFIEENKDKLAHKSQSAPMAYTLTWDIASSSKKLTSQTVVVEENIGGEVNQYTYEVGKNSYLKLRNLKINAVYNWHIISSYGSEKIESNKSTFTTASNGPRNISIPGMENVRDLGGWNIANDKIYRQGLIYRSAELNGAKDGLSKPTDEGLKVIKDELKIKSDIDLRLTESFEAKPEDEVYGITASPVEGLNYLSCPMYFGGTNIFDRAANKDSIKAFFEYLAIEDNYPVMFHCVRGTDRTGALAYVISAMCGVSKIDLMKDYLFSNFANINSSPITEQNISGSGFYVKQIDKCDGDSFAEKTKNYLVENVGVDISTLDKIVSILTASIN